ncbi:MAG: methionyl-tRNA formyltransferase [bacterium]|nr:methionyl-tRNA formyltransferase [bacterium]
MRIVFMGTPAAAAVSLQRVIDDRHDIATIYTQPDRPSGRGNRITFSPVKQLAFDLGIPVLQPAKIRTDEAIAEFRSFNADIAVVVAYGRILPEPFLNAFPLGAVNVHFSLLPKYRGAAPVNWAIVNGERVTGVTTMKMDAGLDTGDILLQEETQIAEDETSIELMARLAELGADLLSKTLSSFSSLEPRPQDHSAATLAPIMNKEDGRFDWTFPAERIARMARGFQPFPTAYTSLEGKKLTLWNASSREEESLVEAGTVIEAFGNQLIVACRSGSALEISEVQIEGKKRMPVRDFLNGKKLGVGDRLD